MHQCFLPHPGLGKGSVRVGRNSFRIRAVTHFADDAHSSRCPASFGPAGPVTGCTTVRRHIGGADESPQPEISPASEVTERPSVVVIQRNAQQFAYMAYAKSLVTLLLSILLATNPGRCQVPFGPR